MTKGQAEAAKLGRAMRDLVGNLASMPGIFPDYAAPIVRLGDDGERELALARWGLPSSKKALLDAATKRADKLRAKGKAVDFAELLRLEPDKGTTNVRNTSSAHWRPFLGPPNRCLVPFTSFCEPDQASGSLEPVWFALGEDRPLAFFAGVHKLSHTCVRKVRDGEVICDLFGFLTTTPNAEVAAVHPKAMPVILTSPEETALAIEFTGEIRSSLRRAVTNRDRVAEGVSELHVAADLLCPIDERIRAHFAFVSAMDSQRPLYRYTSFYVSFSRQMS